MKDTASVAVAGYDADSGIGKLFPLPIHTYIPQGIFDCIYYFHFFTM